MNLLDILDEQVVLINLRATDKQGAIEELATALKTSGKITDLDGVLNAVLEREKIIVINKLKPMEQRIRALAQAFSRLDISAIYLKPAIRDIIDSEINAA